ncbi:cylicin-1 [Cimex lectularius]|uniref:RING-type domain-containing protein n=1 Tax=Cimex lectularius TaxID=79782 RepID=A0A8I6RQ00_CIMLE|nr:cylicin-1 [Cimex lectularius]
MPRNLGSSAFMKPFVVLALPGMYLFYKYSQYKRQQQEQNRRKVTERELAHLNHKIDKLLSKLEENEPELATSQEDECVICVNAKATMQTSPCGHRVVCRKCFVKTIQMAVSQRLLPLRCVICRAKILRLKQSGVLLPNSTSSWSVPQTKSWMVNSASHYSMGPVPNSESLYSMASGSSSISAVSSSSGSSTGSSCSDKCNGLKNFPRQPTTGSLRKSQTHSMKYHLQEYKEPVRSTVHRPGVARDPDKRLPPIQEFQREFRLGKERSTSTRIRCAQKIVTQLETTPVVNNKNALFFRPNPKSEIEKKKAKESQGKFKMAKDDKKKAEVEKADTKQPSAGEGNSKDQDSKDKKAEKAEKAKAEKKDKNKEKELAKAEKKEQKKEAKAEKKNAKKEAKNDKKDKKE